MSDKKIKMLVYTDGGCMPKTGEFGWGVHGYTYEDIGEFKPVKTDRWTLTDKGYKVIPVLPDAVRAEELANSSNPSSAYTPVKPLEYLDFLGSSDQPGTNNRAEILALLRTLEYCLSHPIGTLEVVADSEYVINGVTKWMFTWSKTRWIKTDGAPVINSDLWIRVLETYSKVIAGGLEFSISWVKGHSEDLGNDKADALATIGINYSKAGETINTFNHTPVKGYWKVKSNRHPLLTFKRIYFNSVEEFNDRGMYFQADPGSNDFIIGKRVSDVGYSVVKVNESDPVIETIKDRQYEISKDGNGIFIIRVDNVYSKNVSPYLEAFGNKALLTNRTNRGISFLDKSPITTELNPTGLALRAVDNFNLLEEHLLKFEQLQTNPDALGKNGFNLELQDITSSFFQAAPGKTKLLLAPEMTVGYKNHTVTITRAGKEVELPVILGADLPPRNNLKRLEGRDPSVHVLTWSESKNTFRYSIIIKTNDAVGIWSNFFSDRILL